MAKAKARKVMQWALAAVVKLGQGSKELAKRLHRDRSPEAMIGTLNADIEILTPRRESLAEQLETLYRRIAEGKKELARVAPARRRVLEADLKTRLVEYQALERQYGILLEQERHLHAVRNRLQEMVLYGLTTMDEAVIDEVADDLEEVAAAAEDRSAAVRELERAGRRREIDSDEQSFLEQLEEFELPDENGSGIEAAAGDRRQPALAPPQKAEAEADPEQGVEKGDGIPE